MNATARLASCSMILALVACADKSTPSADFEEARSSLSRDAASLDGAALTSAVDGNTAFGIRLHQKLAKSGENLALAPHSISTALAMVYGGARTTTAAEMEATLGFNSNTHAAMNTLDLALASRAGDGTAIDGTPLKLAVNNAMFAQKGYPFQASFLDLLARDYGAGVKLANFQSDPDGERTRINAYVAANTNDKIKDLLAPGAIAPTTRTVLVNTVYMNAAWQTPFSQELTSDASFQSEGAASTTVKMMHANGSMLYAADSNALAVTLPYAGGKLAFTAILPKGDLSTFEGALTVAELRALTDGSTSKLVDLSLPRIHNEDDAIKLRKPLEALGMVHAFVDGEADFSGIAKPEEAQETLHIDEVVHKVFLDVAEKGTEAAAATAVVVDGTTSVPVDPPIVANFNRPFLIVIRDIPTGAVLFTARIAKL